MSVQSLENSLLLCAVGERVLDLGNVSEPTMFDVCCIEKKKQMVCLFD